MKTTVRKPRKPAPEVHGVARWTVAPFAVRNVTVGMLAINGVEYAATITPGQGVRLTKPGPEAVQYHVDLVNHSCDCKDAYYRKRQCKHSKACVVALAALDNPTPAPALPEAA